MPALPIMGAVAAGHLLDLISVQTARCCTFPLLRSPSPVEKSPASTSFLVSMVAKSSPLASSFKRGCAAGPPCLRRPRGSKPRPTHREDLLAPTGALEQRAAKSLVCAGVLVRSCRAHSTPPPCSFDFAFGVQILQSRTSTCLRLPPTYSILKSEKSRWLRNDHY